MDLKPTIMKIKEKISGLSGREKAITAFTALALFVAAPYMFLYSPSEAKVEEKRQRLATLQTEAQALERAISEQASAPAEARPEPVQIPEADDLHGIFLSISKKANELGVGYISIAPESVSQRDGLMEMRLKLELKLGYRQLHDLISYLGEKHRLFLIESVRFETNDAVYPSGVALIKAVTYLRKA